MSTPYTPESLSTGWLSEALGAQVTAFEVEHFGEGAGVVGQAVRVNLEGDFASPSIIAKFPSPAAENRAVAAAYDMYGRETRFYQSMASQVAMRTPACYYASHDPESGNFVLLLEDPKRFRIGDQVAGCSAADARAVVRALARFHASAWAPGDSLGLPSHNNPAQRDGMIGGFGVGWPNIVEKFAHLIPDSARVAEHALPEATPRLLEEMCSDPVCISHADVRLDNIFFDEVDPNTGEPREVFFVDWQSVCTSAPEQDLAYFVTQSVPPSTIDHAELLSLYHDTLTEAGVDYPRERFEHRYKVSALYLMNYAVVIAGTLDLGNERGVKLAETLLGGCLRSLDTMNAFELLQS